MVIQVEQWPIERIVPYDRNARTHTESQIAQVANSISEFGFVNPILVRSDGVIIAGHARLAAARKLNLKEVPVIQLGHLSETQCRALVLADNRLSLDSGWNDELLRGELESLMKDDLDLDVLGFSDAELKALMTDPLPDEGDGLEEEGELPDVPSEPVTVAGDIWVVGGHRLICGDCRDAWVVNHLFDGRRANVAITSPPYASQRGYDETSGFEPVPPEEYVVWFKKVASNIERHLTPDGSYFLNIKEHANDGERNMYVKKLTIAHVEQWGWRWIDEFCWRKMNEGVPGGWRNRFKNAWEPVFHFGLQESIKFRPGQVSTASENCFGTSLPSGKEESVLKRGTKRKRTRSVKKFNGHIPGEAKGTLESHAGMARPSNVIEVKTETTQPNHPAPFPKALVAFFVKAFTDPGDVVFDPFLGSGTTMAAAHMLDRTGYGCEISPAYCDLILARIAKLAGAEPYLAETGEMFSSVREERMHANPVAG